MKENFKHKLLDSIGRVYEESENSKLNSSLFSKIDDELAYISEYFHTTKNQSFFVSLVFTLNYKGESVDLNDLIKYLDCNPMKILEYSDDFKALRTSGIFTRHKSYHHLDIAGVNDQFVINEKISEAILQNQPMPNVQKRKFSTVFELLENIYQLGNKRLNEDISTTTLFDRAKEIISANAQYPLIKKINLYQLSIEDTYLYLYLIWQRISGRANIDIDKTLITIYWNVIERIKKMQEFIVGNNELLKSNLVEVVTNNFFNNTKLKLSRHSEILLTECDIKIFVNKKKNGNVILPKDILYRKLFFNRSNMEQLSLLKDLLEEDKFIETQKRLVKKKLSKGITVLLHGAPGTGKTEVIKQIAKKSNRELMKVEISQSKSMWFGESEKRIKQIFSDYYLFSKECERTPILFFNEADAIFSKRKEIGSSNITQTENTIQNIMLDELENFDGILIATTNLTKNFDTAFERRFLFKIKLQKPDIKTSVKIWQLKFPSLTLNDCKNLAERFNFSGGQIDNVYRKKEIHEIIYGEKVTLKQLITFCSEETLQNSRPQIGFN